MKDKTKTDANYCESEKDLDDQTGRKQYNLEEMLAEINSENIHPETDWGKPVGREII